MKDIRKDEVGRRFNKLLVVEYAYTKDKSAYWSCICDCGNTVVVVGKRLRNSGTQSCGCLQKERAASASAKHGLSKHPLYKVWKDMKWRCSKDNMGDHKHYAGRGIIVCDEWRFDFMV